MASGSRPARPGEPSEAPEATKHMTKPTKTKTAPGEGISRIADGGLRYTAKPSGSPFPVSQAGIGATRSCYKCGTHKPVPELESKKFLGKNQLVRSEERRVGKEC